MGAMIDSPFVQRSSIYIQPARRRFSSSQQLLFPMTSVWLTSARIRGTSLVVTDMAVATILEGRHEYRIALGEVNVVATHRQWSYSGVELRL